MTLVSGSAESSPLAPSMDWRQLTPRAHLVQFYEGDAFLVDTVVRFLEAGVGRGENGVVIATEAHRRGIRQSLGAAAAGRCVLLDAEETLSEFMVDGWPDDARFARAIGGVIEAAAANGGSSVCAFGEMVAVLWDRGNVEAALRLEALWNELPERLRFSLLCAYPIRAFSHEHARSFIDVCSAHSDVVPTERYSSLDSPRERLRAISLLQREAAALPAETAQREEAERSLHRQQQELADFLENAVEGLHRVGPNGEILWANRAMLELLGCQPEEYVGHHVSEFHADREAFDELWARLIAGEAVYDFPVRLRRKDGAIRHARLNSKARVDDGRLVYTRCFFRDVTERSHLEEELRARCTTLAEADRRKDEFLAMLAHELRNPLSAIRSAVATADLESSARPRALDIARRQVEQLGRLIDDLLDVARITHGRIALRRERVELGDIVERAVEGVRRLAEDRQERLVVDVSAGEIHVDGDPARIEQVIANLLTNAVKFSARGGTIRVVAERRGEEAVLTVGDDGIGIAPELLPHIFDLFTQGDCSLDRAQGGLGIGLTIVRRLVELHGGQIEVQSDGLGKGAKFVVRLPLSVRAAPEAPSALLQPGARRVGAPVRIMLVEDNRDAAESLQMLLEILGHEVRVVHDGAVAVDAAAAYAPDVMVVDIGLPGMDGYQLARSVRRDRALCAVRLVALTGYGGREDRQRAIDAGFDHHLMKPVDLEALRRLIDDFARAEERDSAA